MRQAGRLIASVPSMPGSYQVEGKQVPQQPDRAGAPGARVSVADFGAIPNDGQNDASALRKALDFCKRHPGVILYFSAGRLQLQRRKRGPINGSSVSERITAWLRRCARMGSHAF
jgi:hypothetical protein